MLSRRRFSALCRGRGADRRCRGAKPARPLPPSIAALTSMRSQACGRSRPTSGAAASSKARRLMAEQKIDALMLSRRHLARLLHEHPVGRRRAALRVRHPGRRVSRSSSARPSRKIARASRSRSGPFAGTADVRTWHEHESPYERVAQGLRDRGIATGTPRHRRNRQVRVQRRRRQGRARRDARRAARR